MKLEMLNNLKDSLERKTASVLASIEVLENQIERDKNNQNFYKKFSNNFSGPNFFR